MGFGTTMKHSLRQQLLASHIIPIFLLIPLMGLALIYFMQEYVLIPALANEMVDEGILIRNIAINYPNIWTDSGLAQKFINQLDIIKPTEIVLLNSSDVQLAVSRNSTAAQRAAVGDAGPDLSKIGSSPDVITWQVQPGFFSSNAVLNVIVPVTDTSGHLIGMISLYRLFSNVNQGLANVQLIILGVLFFGLVIYTLIGLVLAETMSRPIRQLTSAIADSSLTGKPIPLPEVGIEEVHQLTRTFNRLQERRYQLEVSRQQMLANLVHEIGRPLGGIQAALYAIMDTKNKDQVFKHELTQGISERVHQMARLVDDIATSYRQPVKPLELDPHTIVIKDWIEKQAPFWAEIAHNYGIRWRVDVSPDLPDITADSSRLEQALGNLLSNAFKFTPNGGKVSLQVYNGNGLIHFQVRDSGCGISKEDQTRIFEPFFRSTNSTEKTAGLGLGLSIARTIIEAHHGTISLESTPGEGSTFTIFLPD